MNPVRGLLRELIDRRLWPVAVLLLAAAVAIPIYIGRTSADTGSVAPPAVNQQANAGKTSKAAVSIEDPAADDDRRGGVRNPFTQRHLPKDTTQKPASPTGGTTPDAGGSGGAGSDGGEPPLGPAGGTGGSGGSGDGGSKGSGGGSSTTDPLDVYHLTLRFGEAGHLKTLSDVARLSPLPSADNPFFVYTGVLKDGKTAVFLLSSDAEATGDGHCRPSAKSCQTIEVKQGDTEFFDLTVNDEPVQYQLDVVRVFKKGASSSSAAAAAYERHSNAGSNMLRKAHRVGSSAFKGQASYRWLPESGVLVRAPKRGNARASVNGAAAASPADATGALPGLPVWAWDV